MVKIPPIFYLVRNGAGFVSFRCGHPLSMGRAVSRFGKPAGSHPARYSHRSRVASAALHCVLFKA
ncbi:hypothetical protein [Rossellomorea marisflavi]|uniref:hypothetical protein n=1 Tax=Rossellomorea marisflavi TaxID=189381 RepID=UPI001364B9E8|nr:hypothetical protein [Rossellomorea marisflavi]